MSVSDEHNHDRDDLIARYLDGSATAEDAARVRHLIEQDTSAAEAFYWAAFDTVVLRELAAKSSIAARVQDAEEDGDVETPQQRVPPAARRLRTPPAAARARQQAIIFWRHPSVRWGGIAACVLVATFVGWRLSHRASTGDRIAGATTTKPTELTANPGVYIATAGNGTWRHGATERNLTAGAQLDAGDRVHIARGGAAALGISGQSTRIDVSSDTTLGVTPDGKARRFDLSAGVITCHADKQSPQRPLVFVTAQARCTVVGTIFTLTALDNATRLQVAEGTVHVERASDGAWVDVNAGTYIDVSTSGGASAVALDPAPEKSVSDAWHSADTPGSPLEGPGGGIDAVKRH